MKPTLIVLNGAPGVGKSTLAEKYADMHPLTLKLDVDVIRRFISDYREQFQASGKLSKTLALEMARTHLQCGYDVIIAQCYRKPEYMEALEKLAQDCNAGFYEFLLSLSKAEAIARFIKRGQKEGAPDGFLPDSLVTRGGGKVKLESMYDEMMDTVSKRPNTKVIEPTLDDIAGTYAELMRHLTYDRMTHH